MPTENFVDITIYSFSKEMQFILNVSKTVFLLNSNSNYIQNLNLNQFDLDKLHQLLIYHNIRPVFLKGLTIIDSSIVPSDFLKKLKYECYQISVRGLLNTKELLRLLKIFRSQNIQVIPYKGITLAQSYYGDLGLRESSDIDLFVDLKDLITIKKILIEESYQPQFFLNSKQEELFLSQNCEYNFDLRDEKNSRYFHVEPHYFSNSVIDGINPINFNQVKEKLQKSAMFGESITLLAPLENLLLILTHHAVKEGWSKLKYILDIHLIIEKDNEVLDWTFLNSKIQKIGIQNQVLVGFSLSHKLFNTEFPEEIIKQFSHSKIQVLVIERIRELNRVSRNVTQRDIKTFLFNLRSKNSNLSKLKFCWLRISHPIVWDIKIIVLPKYLRFLYPIVRLLRLFLRVCLKKNCLIFSKFSIA